MKKLFTVAIALLLIVLSCVTVTAQTPIGISNEEQLKAIKSNKSYYLKNDITLSGDFTPIAKFSGSFDGRGKKIINLKITVNAKEEQTVYAGLFAEIDAGEIKNLTLENVKINVTGGGTVYAGAICASVLPGRSISNCRVGGEIVVNSTNASVKVGGIAGRNYARLNLCENSAKITVNARHATVGGIVGDQPRSESDLVKCANLGIISVSVTGAASYAGGIAGNTGCDIKDCANYGSVSLSTNGDAYVGGIAAGNTNGEISTCFSGGTLSCSGTTISNVDPIVALGGKRFSNNFYLDKIITGLSATDVKTATAIEAKNLSNAEYFKEFDFDNVWEITSNGPVLSCITAAKVQNKVEAETETDTSTPTSNGSSSITSNGSTTNSSGSLATDGSGDTSQGVTSGDSSSAESSPNSGAMTSTPSGKENAKFPVWIIIVLVVLAAIAGAVVIFVKNNKGYFSK